MKKTDGGWGLLRSDEDLCKMELEQYSIRLMLVIEFEEYQAWESGYNGCFGHMSSVLISCPGWCKLSSEVYFRTSFAVLGRCG